MMKYLLKAVVCSVILSCLLSMTGFYGACEDIRQEVFRLHILANSDSDEDQRLKLTVRDRVLGYTEELFRNCNSKEESIRTAKANIKEITAFAQSVVKEQGYEYPVKVYVTKMPFTTRVYDQITLPAGQYDALRIVIGSGQGHNWWCVLYPALCLPSASGNELSGVISEGEEEIVSAGEKYEVKFWLIEWWEGLLSVFG